MGCSYSKKMFYQYLYSLSTIIVLKFQIRQRRWDLRQLHAPGSLGVISLGYKRAVGPLDFPVGLRPVWPGTPVLDLRSKRVSERV